MKKPKFIAHRGDTSNFPENTIEAFNSAIKKGADGIEFDVHLNQVGNPIVVHNYSFDKNNQYPLLSEILEIFGKKTHLEIEIKSLDDGAVGKIAETIDLFRPVEIEITSSVQPLFWEIKKHFKSDKRGLIFRSNLLENWMSKDFITYMILRYTKLLDATVLHLDLDLYTPELIQILQKNQITTHTHLSNTSKEAFEKMMALGIDQCTFDDINVLKLR